MQAIQVKETGGPEVLAPNDVTVPDPGPGEALVEIEAAGVNFIDVYHRTGLYPLELPFTPGVEAAGTIAAVGPDPGDFRPGDRVVHTGTLGAYAHRQVVPVASLVTVPDGIGLDVAAAVHLQGMTAHYLSQDTYPLGPDSLCLVHAGAGGVGLLLTQMAKLLGATVVTTVSTDEKEALSREAGADHVIRYTEEDLGESGRRLLSELGRDGFDVVYDSVGATTFDTGLDLLRLRGTMALFGQSSGPVPPVDLRILNTKGSLFVTRPTLFHYVATRPDLERRAGDVFGWIEAGRLDVRIGARFDLADAADAHRALEGRRTTGKVILVP